ncbi:hypothetical protein JCM8208_007195 [Rhodotorula glutinis]
MLVRPDLTGLPDDEHKGFERIMRHAEKTWNEVRLTTPASFALALVAADKVTLAYIAAQCNPATSTRRLAGLERARDEAKAARRQADKALMHDYGEHILEMGDEELARLSTAIQKRLEEPANVTDWAKREHDRALALHPDTSPDDTAAYLDCLERARIGHALARYLLAVADEAIDFLHLRVQARKTGPGTRTVERGSALGRIGERHDEDQVEDAEANSGEGRQCERDARDRARATVTASRRARRAHAPAEDERCRVQ